MKTKEEVAKEYVRINYSNRFIDKEDLQVAFIDGVNWALSQPKEVEPQTEITSAELWQNRYESLLKGLNDITNELNVYKVNKDFDLDELKESYIELCKTYNASSFIKIWNFFLPHLQKPIESDAVEFLEWIGNDWTKLKNGWMKSDLYTTIEATHTTTELYEQFKQLKKQDYSLNKQN
jgi:hypothetical protein